MLTRETALKLYRQVYLIRRAEEKIREDYSTDAMKTPVHLCVGAEAIHAGVFAALPERTQLFGTYRNHGLYLAATQDPLSFFAELYGRANGCAQGKAGSMHLAAPDKGLIMTSAVVATTIPVAVGAAFANAYKGNTDTAAVFFGDGALEEGAFWEGFNFACLHKLRILFVCEDNDLAIHTFRKDRQGFRSIGEVAAAFQCHTENIDGYDPEVVYEAAERLMRKMKKDPQPAFLHAKYFRFLEHVGINEDFKSQYRPAPESAQMEKMDPLLNAEKLAVKMGNSMAEISKIKTTLETELTNAVQKAKAGGFPDAKALMSDVYS